MRRLASSVLPPPLASAAALSLVVLAAAPAHADVSFDLGYVRSRVAVTDQTALDAHQMRFAIRADLDVHVPHLHVGSEAEEGVLSGSTPLPNGIVARAAPGTAVTGSPLEGNVLALKVFAGLHANMGSLRLGADVAGGFRDAWVESDAGMDVAGRKYEPLFELRTRADLRVSRCWRVGGMASNDVIEQRNVSLAFLVTLDCGH